MPTAARLIAALCLGVLAWIISDMVKPLLPEGTDFGYFNFINLAIGILTGWIVVGSRAGRGYSAAIGNGLTGVVVLVFWGLFLQSWNEMFRLALRRRYDGPVEALADVFQIGFDWGQTMVTSEIMISLLVGACLTGILSELAARLWR